MSSASRTITIILMAIIMLPGCGFARAAQIHEPNDGGGVGVEPLPPMISNFTMQKPENSPLGQIRAVIQVSDFNGVEDICNVSIALYHFDQIQASASFRQYDVNCNITKRNPQFIDTFGGFLAKSYWEILPKESPRWYGPIAFRLEFFFQPVPVTDVRIKAEDTTKKQVEITVSVSPSARASLIREAYIPWVIAVVIATIVAIAVLWIRNSSNRLAKIAEKRKKAMGALAPSGKGEAQK